MNTQQRNTIISAVMALLIGFVVCWFFFRRASDALQAPKITPVAAIEKKVQADESNAAFKLDSLNVIAARLNRIAADQKINSGMLSRLYGDFSDSAIAFVERMHAVPGNDYADGSVAAVVSQIHYLREISERKDSACTAGIDTLQKIVAVKDAVILEKDSLYNRLRVNFDTIATQQKALITYSGQQAKALRKKKAVNTALKVGTLLLGGFILAQQLK